MSSALSIKWVMGPQAWGLAWGLVALLLALTLAFFGWKLWNWRDGIARCLARFSLAGAFVFGGLVGSAVLNGGEKVGGTNGTDQASMPTNGMSGVSHPANGPSMVGAPLRLGEEPEPTEPELRFTSIEPGDAGVTLGLEWTPNLPLPDGKIGIYGKLDLRDPIWSWLGVWMPPSGATSGTVFVGDESLTGDSSVHPPMAFFKASTVADSDGDGLRDRDETGWVEHGAALPAFDFADAVDVADASSGGLDSGVRVVQLPFKAKLAGCFSDRVSICVDGVVGFLPMGFASARFWDMTTNRDMSDGYLYNEDVPVVAVYWDDLSLPLGTDGRIRTLSTVVDDENWFVVEYANVRLSAERWSAYTSRATIQVAVCEADPSTVYVRYLSLAGQFDGSSATLGAQGVVGTPNFPVAYNESGSIASGDVIAYHFGCGGSPQMRDTDGDGLDDGRELEEGTSAASADTDGDGLLDKWELDNGLDPTSADGQDGGCGDADGDGLSNADEQAHGTNPWLGDSDGDGLEDGEEAGGIVPVYGTGLPWLTFDSSTDLTASFSSDDFSLVSWRLPGELVIHGVSVENVVVDANGAVYFCRAGGVPPQGAWPCFSVEDVENDDVLVVVPYWSRFEIDTESTLPTRIRAGVATHGGVDYVLIECEHLHGAVGFDDESVLSYQLAVPTDHPERMFVRYRVDAGEEFTGENGVVQSLDFGQGPSHAYGLAESQGIATGLSLQFLFGFGSDPLRADGDDDGLSDVDELENGSDPNRVDTDSDGIPDGWELENGLDPLDPTDAALDPDGDGLDNLGEYLNETDPSGDDLDEDGVPDGYDTDGDGVDDGTEVENGSDPNDPLDLGIPPPLDECRPIDFGIAGDYAAWEMKIEGLGPYDWRTMRLSMAAPGWSVTSGMKLLHKGNTYRLTMRWLNSDGHDDECAPWYCWETQIDGLPSEQTFDNYSNTRKPGVAEIVIGDGWIAENASGLLTSHVHECTREFDGSFGGGNVARGKEVLLYVWNAHHEFLFETENKTNRIFNPTPKDDSTGNTAVTMEVDEDHGYRYALPRNYLYVVANPNTDKFDVTERIRVEPEAASKYFVCGAFDNGNFVPGSIAHGVDDDGALDFVMHAQAPLGNVDALYEIRFGVVDGSPTSMDFAQSYPLVAYSHGGEPRNVFVKGITISRYEYYRERVIDWYVRMSLENNPIVPSFVPPIDDPPSRIAPHARSFLRLFYDNGSVEGIKPEYRPSSLPPEMSSESTLSLDAFATTPVCFTEWLSHNAGAPFNEQDKAVINRYYWDRTSEVSRFLARQHPFVLKTSVSTSDQYQELATDTGAKLKNFYDSQVKPQAELLLRNTAVGTEIILPSPNGWYGHSALLPYGLFISLSPSWVPGITMDIGSSSSVGGWDALLTQVVTDNGAFHDFDAFGTIGRGRVLNPTYQFTVKKVSDSGEDGDYKVVNVRFSCRIEDLYDFNYEDSDLSAHAAALQIGHGKGQVPAYDQHGKIFCERIDILADYPDPFTLQLNLIP